ncbi:MAG TPA: hypothetical protein VNH84_02825 [Candidatus Saccharimonadales bacterium]|nr:hypothetical protein [Candidatus Saccharimonadales bacterium]
MRTRRPFRLGLLFAPMLLWVLVVTSPFYSAHVSLAFHGRPFARVVPKETLDVFQFVQTDNLRCRAIVFSGEEAVGWILQPFGFARFVPFSETPNFQDVEFPDMLSDVVLPIAWTCRWWLLGAQALLLFWFAANARKAQALAAGPKAEAV